MTRTYEPSSVNASKRGANPRSANEGGSTTSANQATLVNFRPLGFDPSTWAYEGSNSYLNKDQGLLEFEWLSLLHRFHFSSSTSATYL